MKEQEQDKRKNLSFFHLMFPAFILAILSFISTNGMSFGNVVIISLLKFGMVYWQAIVLKNFIESVY